MNIALYVGIFVLGVYIGIILRSVWTKRSTVGTLHVSRNDTRTLYSLELEDYPESLAFRKVVLFKVDTSEEKPDRD